MATVIPAGYCRRFSPALDCPFLILRGVQTAASINLVATLAKLLPLGAFIVLAIMMFKLDTFTLDFTGVELGIPVWEQVKNTMLITLWVFIGVEGAVVVSARAKNKRDVGRATLLAVLAALGIYLRSRCFLWRSGASGTGGDAQPVDGRTDGKNDGAVGRNYYCSGTDCVCLRAYLSWTIMAAEVPFLAAAYKSFRASSRDKMRKARLLRRYGSPISVCKSVWC